MKTMCYLGCLLVGLLLGCSDDSQPPESQSSDGLKVRTLLVEKIGSRSALGYGSVDMVANPEIIDKGVIWSKTPGATIDSPTRTSGPPGTGTYSSVLGVLEPGTKYYFKAYAWNGVDLVYGDELTFTTTDLAMFTPGIGVEDADGNKYETVILENKEWMAENLRTSKFSNGDDIPNAQVNNISWQSFTTPAWGHYNNLSQLDAVQGKLYNWYAVSDTRNVCPAGWHVPAVSEWNELIEFLGGKWLAPVRMMTPAPTWIVPPIATNESGFSAIHGGICTGWCNDFYGGAFWWSATPDDTNSLPIPWDPQTVPKAHYIGVGPGNGPVWKSQFPYMAGMSIRCVKD